MYRIPALRSGLAAGLCSLAIAACGQGTGPGRRAPVNFQVAASAAARTTAASPAGAVNITGVRLAILEASLGSGDQFGCQDCQGGSDNESAAAARIVSVPVGGGAVSVASDEVKEGTYRQAEVSLAGPAAAQGWTPGATIEIQGDVNGAGFTLPLAIPGSFRETLEPPVVVAGTTSPSTVSVTITLPIASWFQSATGPLDPADPAQRAQIEANARASFQPLESGGRGER